LKARPARRCACAAGGAARAGAPGAPGACRPCAALPGAAGGPAHSRVGRPFAAQHGRVPVHDFIDDLVLLCCQRSFAVPASHNFIILGRKGALESMLRCRQGGRPRVRREPEGRHLAADVGGLRAPGRGARRRQVLWRHNRVAGRAGQVLRGAALRAPRVWRHC